MPILSPLTWKRGHVLPTDKFLSLSAPAVFPAKLSAAEFMGPVLNQGNLGACHDDKTMVLTNVGWKLFKDLSGNELLASVDPITSTMIFDKPTRIIKKPYKGTMVCADRNKLNFKVTPDHQMLVRKWNEKTRKLNSTHELVNAGDLGWYCGLMNQVSWNGKHVDTYVLSGIPNAHQINHRDSSSISMKGWMKFLGIYLAEGTALKEKNKIQIAASKEREKSYFKEVLKDLGIHALELNDRFTFGNKPIHNALKELGLYGVKSYDKFVPEFIFNQSVDNIKLFLEGHFMGDGSAQIMTNSVDTMAHYTSSPALAEGLQTLIFMSGKICGVSSRPPRNGKMNDGRIVVGKHNEYRVSVCESANLSIDKKADIYYEEYDGMVYCAEVPTYHTLVTKRENCILISGNCTAHGYADWVMAALKKADLPVFLISRLFQYYNERLREGTVSTDAGAIVRDAFWVGANYGIVDETQWPYDVSKFAVVPPTEVYANAKKDTEHFFAPLDPSNIINQIKTSISHGQPYVFGFDVFGNFDRYESGVLELPSGTDQYLGGHCVCGYQTDDSVNACLIRNSWDTTWGIKGDFWMSYDYLASRMASDFWTGHIQKIAA